MAKRLRKVATIKELEHKDFNVVIGTECKEEPKTMYIKYKLWLGHKRKSDLDFQREMAKINKFARQYTYNITSDILSRELKENYFDSDKTIVNLKSPAVGFKYGDQCYVELEITVFQTGIRRLLWESHEIKTLYRELNHGITFYLRNHENYRIGFKGKVAK